MVYRDGILDLVWFGVRERLCLTINVAAVY